MRSIQEGKEGMSGARLLNMAMENVMAHWVKMNKRFKGNQQP